MYIKKLKIGNVELENNILLAPMAGVTDMSFRTVVKNYGAGLVCTEMASAKAIYYKDKKTQKLLDTSSEKRPIAVQLFGNDIESMEYATKYINDEKMADIIDINMGCPAPKVTKNGDGSKLLLDLKKVEEISKAVVKSSKIPVTVKYRKGWDDKNIVAIQVAKILEWSGISAITIHGRTSSEFYSGKADLDIIKKVKESVNIPVIGNGDIKNGKSAKEMLDTTGVDGIMIGRGILGAPWVIEHIIDYLNGKDIRTITNKEKLEIILKHIDLNITKKSEELAIKELRKHIAWYIKGLPEATRLRQEINKIVLKQELTDCLTEYFNNI